MAATMAATFLTLCGLFSTVHAFLGLPPRLTTLPTTSSRACVTRGAAASMVLDLPKLEFRKYHGIGNDFILIDNRKSSTPLLTPDQSKEVCRRRFGVGADGVIFLVPGQDGTDFGMRIYNSDGSEPEMCGNGIRCLAKYIRDLEGSRTQGDRSYTISTGAGVIKPVVRQDGLVTVDMGKPIFEGPRIPTTLSSNAHTHVIQSPLDLDGRRWEITALSMGNPHAVIFVPDLNTIDLDRLGPKFESHPVFPRRTNTEFVQVISPQLFRMTVWERGAGATLACGTGACAVMVAGVVAGKTDAREVTVQLPGGDLMIEWRKADERVYMTGGAEPTFSGVLGT